MNFYESNINQIRPVLFESKNYDGYIHGYTDNYIRVKTVYELAMEANPSMFFPHDEFETVNEYKERVSGQVGLMKDIVQK